MAGVLLLPRCSAGIPSLAVWRVGGFGGAAKGRFRDVGRAASAYGAVPGKAGNCLKHRIRVVFQIGKHNKYSENKNWKREKKSFFTS